MDTRTTSSILALLTLGLIFAAAGPAQAQPMRAELAALPRVDLDEPAPAAEESGEVTRDATRDANSRHRTARALFFTFPAFFLVGGVVSMIGMIVADPPCLSAAFSISSSSSRSSCREGNEDTGIGVGILGGGLAGVGLTLLVTAIGLEVDARAARRGEESEYTLALAPGPGDVGLSVGLSF